MENKTDKPYSLQISDLLDNILPADGVGTERERLRMTLHTEISKATEELRKENEKLKATGSQANISALKSICAIKDKEIERIKESNKQLEEWKRQQIEVTGPIFDWGQSQKDLRVGTSIIDEILKRLEEHKALKESNKELVEALKVEIEKTNKSAF